MVCACNNPSNAGHSHKCPSNAYASLKAFTVVHDRDNTAIMRQELPIGLQTNSYEAKNILGTMPNRFLKQHH